MDKIISDFKKSFRHTALGYWLCTAMCLAGFLLSGVFVKAPTRIPAAAVAAFLVSASAYTTLEIFFTAPKRFREKLGRLPEKTRGDIITQYERAACFGKKWFLEEYLLFHGKRKIELLRFDEIRSAEPKGFKMELELLDGKKKALLLEPNENPAVIAAALRSKNPQISVMIDGRVVDRMENKK